MNESQSILPEPQEDLILEEGDNGKKAEKVIICHNTESGYIIIEVNGNALDAHIAHGDVMLVDNDGDGYVTEENECLPYGDCDDTDPHVNPGAEEICNDNIDNNCNGETDENCSGTFVDERDGHEYNWVIIGDQKCMAENLAYDSDGSYLYDTPEHSEQYGRLYTWAAANNGACPNGWHLPSDDEWKQMEIFIGLTEEEADDGETRGTNEGDKLKSISGWNNNGNGTDEYGFSGLPGGYGSVNGGFGNIGIYGYWWSSTKN